MKYYSIYFSTKAKNDLFKIVNYIKFTLEEPTIAEKYYKLIIAEINTLNIFPKRFAIIDSDNFRGKEVRKINIKNFIALYRVDEKNSIVIIDSIIYGRFNWKKIKWKRIYNKNYNMSNYYEIKGKEENKKYNITKDYKIFRELLTEIKLPGISNNRR